MITNIIIRPDLVWPNYLHDLPSPEEPFPNIRSCNHEQCKDVLIVYIGQLSKQIGLFVTEKNLTAYSKGLRGWSIVNGSAYHDIKYVLCPLKFWKIGRHGVDGFDYVKIQKTYRKIVDASQYSECPCGCMRIYNAF